MHCMAWDGMAQHVHCADAEKDSPLQWRRHCVSALEADAAYQVTIDRAHYVCFRVLATLLLLFSPQSLSMVTLD